MKRDTIEMIFAVLFTELVLTATTLVLFSTVSTGMKILVIVYVTAFGTVSYAASIIGRED